MYGDLSGLKLKNKPMLSTVSHLNTYQGEPIRKSIVNDLRVRMTSGSTTNIPSGCSLKPAINVPPSTRT
jgi:hypothetical protein